MTEEALGEELDFGHGIVSQRTISDIELGKREIKPSELGQIARALGVTTDQLIEGLGYTGEPISVTGGGKAGTKGRGQRG